MKQNHHGEIRGWQFNQKLFFFLVVTGRQRNSCSLYQVRSYKHCCQSNLKENHRYHLSVFKGPTICPITWGSNFKRTRTPGDTSFIFMVTDYSKQSPTHTHPPPSPLSLKPYIFPTSFSLRTWIKKDLNPIFYGFKSFFTSFWAIKIQSFLLH